VTTLAQGLAELEASAAHPKAVAEIRRLLERGSDFDCYKVNAFRIAEATGLPRREALRAFLFATRIGLFDLAWDIHCPACSGIPEFYKHLIGLRNAAHCGLCKLDWDVDLEDQVEVTFTPNPAVRPVAYTDFAERDFAGQLAFFNEVLPREGRDFTIGGTILLGDVKSFAGAFEPGDYTVWVPPHLDLAARVRVVEGGPRHVDVVVAADGRIDPPEFALAPGRAEIAVTSRYPTINGFLVRPVGQVRNWVSAAYVTSQQDFRDLFAGEFLSPDASFAIRNVTLMFTDIKGSTELYEALGDARAYARVQEHFRVMTEVIREHDGGIVKTIGDAVMAAFPSNESAVRAAIEVQRRFKREGDVLGGIEVKIGLHRGPAIAVTSNRSLDYFGRTVNVAARVQGESRAGEVLLSDDVLRDQGVVDWLASQGIRPLASEVHLKGVASTVRIHALRSNG